MPDKRFAAMEQELKAGLEEFTAYLEKENFEKTPANFLVRGATRFALFLVGRPVMKGDPVPRDWREKKK